MNQKGINLRQCLKLNDSEEQEGFCWRLRLRGVTSLLQYVPNVFYTVKVYCRRVIHFSLWLCFANEVHYFLSLVYSIFLRWEISLILKVKIKHLFWQDKEISDCPHSVSQSPGVTYYLPAF